MLLIIDSITPRTAPSIAEKSATLAAPVKSSSRSGGLMKASCAAPIRGMILVSGPSRTDSLPRSLTCFTPNEGIMSASRVISHSPSQSTFMSSLMPSVVVLETRTPFNFRGTVPRSILVKWRVFNGPGSIVLNMGSAISLIIWLPATLMFGHSCSTISFRKTE